jgi:cytochrome P450
MKNRKVDEADNKDLKQMVYLEGFLNEVLRLKTPAASLLIRETKDDVKVGSINIKKSK